MQDIQTVTAEIIANNEQIATAENKPNVSFPRDSSTTLGMTENVPDEQSGETIAENVNEAIDDSAVTVTDETDKDNVTLTVESGVEPVKMEYQAVYRAGEESPKAFISRAIISGLPYGSFLPESYEPKIENNLLGAHLTARLIKKAAKKIDLILQNNPQAELDFIALPAYNAFLLSPDLYGELQQLLKGVPREVYSKICLIISESAFKPLQNQIQININEKLTDIKAFGLKTMISGFGKSDFPVTSLIGVEADYVGVSEETAALLNDKNTKESAMALMRFAATTGAAVVVNGIETDEQTRSLYFGDCYGFTAKAGFVGMDGEKGGYLGEDEALGLIGGGEQ